MTADQSHRFALTGQNPEGRNRTIILWREADLIDGKVVRRVGAHPGRHDDHRDDAHSCRSHRGGAGDPGGGPVSAPATVTRPHRDQPVPLLREQEQLRFRPLTPAECAAPQTPRSTHIPDRPLVERCPRIGSRRPVGTRISPAQARFTV